MIEYVSNAQIVAFAVTASYQYLCPNAEAQSQHEDGNVENTSQGGRSQFYFAYAAQKGSVRHAYELFHQHADEDRIGNAPNLAVRVSFHEKI